MENYVIGSLLSAGVSIALALTPTFELIDERPLLDAAFYAGESDDGSDATGRGVVVSVSPSPNGSTVAFLAQNLATRGNAVFLVNLDDPSSWRRLTKDYPPSFDFPACLAGPLYWTPDGDSILTTYYRVPIASGEAIKHLINGYEFFVGTGTRLESGNWVTSITQTAPGLSDYILLPILPNGSGDPTRSPVRITGFRVDSSQSHLSFQDIRQDGEAMVFSYFPAKRYDLNRPSVSDIYALEDLAAIRDAPKIDGRSTIAPQSLNDRRIIEIRAGSSENYVHYMRYSPDGTFVIFGEDFNNAFNSLDADSSLLKSDFDIMIANADNSSEPYRIVRPGNQRVATPFVNGSRIVYIHTEPGSSVGQLFGASLRVRTPVMGKAGGPAAAKSIVTTVDWTVTDGSGTRLTTPPGTRFTFPPLLPHEITITTPVITDSAEESSRHMTAVPVVRKIGPEGTTFAPPLTVTIRYTPWEIAELDEEGLQVMRKDAGNGFRRIPNEDLVSVDNEANTVTFRMAQSGTFGIGGAPPNRGLRSIYPTIAVCTILGLPLAIFGVWRRRDKDQRLSVTIDD